MENNYPKVVSTGYSPTADHFGKRKIPVFSYRNILGKYCGRYLLTTSIIETNSIYNGVEILLQSI
ncbi:MAG: hypothetical protein ACLQF0_07225, partial [Dissulfurispiraceae bacterium]